MAISSKFGWGLVLTISLLVACNEPNPSFETSSSSIPSGEELYALHCASCHGGTGDLGMSGAKNLKTTKLSVEEIKHIINTGKNAMPSFRGVLGSKGHIDSLSRFVTTLHE